MGGMSLYGREGGESSGTSLFRKGPIIIVFRLSLLAPRCHDIRHRVALPKIDFLELHLLLFLQGTTLSPT